MRRFPEKPVAVAAAWRAVRKRAVSLASAALFFVALAVPWTALASPEMTLASDDPFAGLAGTLRIVGSDVGFVPAKQAAEKIMAAHPGVVITVAMTGAGAGNRQVRLRQAELCLYDRDPADMAHQGAPLTYVAYGVDPVAIVVNPANPVGPLAADQIRSLFSGKVKLWNEVGGGSYAVRPFLVSASEAEGSSGITGDSLGLAMIFALVRNRDILGYASFRELSAAIKPLVVDGASPDLESFRQGRYRVCRIMYASYEEARPSLAQAFVKYMTGPQGQELLVKAGYLPLSEKPAWESVIPVGFPSSRLATGK